MIIPSARDGMRVAGGYHAKFREWRIGCETFIRKHVEMCGMIDRQKLHLIQIDGFFHRLEKTETQLSVTRLQTFSRHFQIFSGVRYIALTRRDPMADNARP